MSSIAHHLDNEPPTELETFCFLDNHLTVHSFIHIYLENKESTKVCEDSTLWPLMDVYLPTQLIRKDAQNASNEDKK